jgi:hypothetical protein
MPRNRNAGPSGEIPLIVRESKSILERFLQARSCIDPCFIPDDTWERLPEPSMVGKARVGGIDFHKQRMRRVAETVPAPRLAARRIPRFGTAGSSGGVPPPAGNRLRSTRSRLRS